MVNMLLDVHVLMVIGINLIKIGLMENERELTGYNSLGGFVLERSEMKVIVWMFIIGLLEK